jgi:hypothetical protein
MILIHRVSSGKRLALLEGEAAKLFGRPTAIHFFNTYDEAAELLAAAGWISGTQRDEVINDSLPSV